MAFFNKIINSKKVKMLQEDRDKIISSLYNIQTEARKNFNNIDRDWNIRFEKLVSRFKNETFENKNLDIKKNVYQCIKDVLSDCLNYCYRGGEHILEMALLDIEQYIADANSDDLRYVDPEFIKAKTLERKCNLELYNNEAIIQSKIDLYNNYFDEWENPDVPISKKEIIENAMVKLLEQINNAKKKNKILEKQAKQFELNLVNRDLQSCFKSTDILGGSQEYLDETIDIAYNNKLKVEEINRNINELNFDKEANLSSEEYENIINKKFTRL